MKQLNGQAGLQHVDESSSGGDAARRRLRSQSQKEENLKNLNRRDAIMLMAGFAATVASVTDGRAATADDSAAQIEKHPPLDGALRFDEESRANQKGNLMNKSSNNHNPHREFITPDNAVLLFIDHQTAIMAGVGDMDPVRLRNNVLVLAKIAKLHKLPTVLSDNMPEGFAGPILPELVKLLPDAPLIHRDGPINAWDDPKFVKAIEATGRRKLIIAGCTTDICLMFPALSALRAGYDVYGVIDASGTWSALDQQIAVWRLVHAGVVVMNTANVLTELQYNHRRPTDEMSGQLFGELVPSLSYTGTQLQQRATTR